MALLASDNSPSWSVSREVELVWRVHLLNPQCYINDCMRQFGKVILHQCNDPNAVYYPHNQSQFRQKILHNHAPGRTGFIMPDLVMTDAIKRQCKFIHKMIKINLWKPIYLEQLDGAITRYSQFMAAMWAPDKPQGLIMVPTNDIDLIWHSHQLDPTGYHSFCITNSPKKCLVSHDDNIAPSVLHTNNNGTEAFWNQKYGANSYMGGRQFREYSHTDYEKMKIYDPMPLWKVGPAIAAVIAVIAGIAMIADPDLSGLCMFVIVALLVGSCYMYSKKTGDLAERKRIERRRDAQHRFGALRRLCLNNVLHCSFYSLFIHFSGFFDF